MNSKSAHSQLYIETVQAILDECHSSNVPEVT